ncbi:MAG: DinB family protein [Leptospiraceae bacterium]|nr:DinB family protein [Leptospiraceae bacterium]
MTESLLDYDTWAYSQVKDHAIQLNDEQFNRDLGDGIGSVKGKLQHLLWAEEMWARRIQGENPAADLGLPDLQSAGSFYEDWDHRRASHFARMRSELQGNPGKSVSYQNTRGESYEQPIWQIVLHVVNHGTFHRGQISSMHRRLTGNPIPLDMILFHRN